MKQLDVFSAPINGISLVEASAGTGKTYSITSLYIRVIIEKKLHPSKILVLTYTEAATTELKSRIRKRINETIDFLNSGISSEDDFLNTIKKNVQPSAVHDLKQALFSFDEASIFTIHGFCQKLLREESFSFGVQPDFEIIQDSSEIFQDAVDSFWKESVEKYSSTDQGKGILEYLINEKISPETIKPVIEIAISKPYARILPEHSLAKEIDEKIERIQKLNDHIKYIWEVDRDELQDIIFSGKLNKRSYKPETFREVWKDLEKWISRSTTNFSGFAKLENFGELKLSTSVNKGNEITVPKISELIDQFLEETKELNILKAGFLKEAIVKVKDEIEARKERINSLSFDDLLQKVSNRLSPKLASKISVKYPIALVDEFQDTDPIQYSIFREIYRNKGSSLFIIGDPKQAIYSFRGADLFTYFEAIKDVKESQQYSLNYNYRSSKEMISAVNSIFSRLEDPFVFDQPKFKKVEFPDKAVNLEFYLDRKKQVPFSFVDCDAEGKNKSESKEIVCSYVANQVEQLLNNDYTIGEDRVSPGDISILVRTKAEGSLVADTLREKGIKSISRSNSSVFDTQECSELRIILKAIHENSNHDLVRAALTTSYIGFTADSIINLFNDVTEWESVIQSFRDADEAWKKSGFLKGLHILNQSFDIRTRLSKLNNAERRLTNFDHLLELISEMKQDNIASPSSLIRILDQKISSTSNPADEEVIRLESDSDLVSISTLHSSKGLEYPIVFIPFLWDEFERRKNTGVKVLEFHNDSNELNIDLIPANTGEKVQQARKESLADTLRLTYVALTRAKTACFIPFTSYKKITNSPLFALLCGSNELLTDTNKNEEKLNRFYSDLEELDKQGSIRIVNSEKMLAVLNSSKETVYEKDLFSQNQLAAKQFNRSDIGKFSRVVSFSSLTSSKESGEGVKDYDQLDYEIKEDSEIIEGKEELSRATFPKGSNTGNLLHNIFEYIDFENSDKHVEVIENQCKDFGFENKWLPVLKTWVDEVLSHNLKGEFSLSDLPKEDVLKELEFHFPVSEVSSMKISQIIRSTEEKVGFQNSVSGFMKGFIDLIFRHEGKYYILDYKSNYLGSEVENYNHDLLREKIVSSNFDIQYHIYTLALKLYLEQRKPDFDYENEFGGVLYLFLRGVDSDKKNSGIYFDCPSKEIIDELESSMGELING